MNIRKSTPQDLDILMNIYEIARRFMQKTGNPGQWIDGYPSEEVILSDIKKDQSYLIIDNTGEIVGTFCFFTGDDPTYARIYDGQWLNDEPYGVIHRLAGNGEVKGLGDYCLQWCLKQCNNIRVDTHPDNKVMQKIFRRNGFTECGIIHTHNGTPRIAFQKYMATE